MHKFPHIIAIDWLQLYLHDKNGASEHLGAKYNGKSYYEFDLQECSTRQFKELWNVLNQDGDLYAVIQRVPFSSIISADGAIIKLANRELYKKDMIITLNMFLQQHGFEVKSISRLDVCFDSNVLANELTHKMFIRGIMDGKYLKNNQGRAHWEFAVDSSSNRPMECNSCSFGSGSSPVKTKMYNKTKEMQEVKDKPYIRELWALNDIDTEKDVWRIEISIKADMTNVVKLSTGETFRLRPDLLKHQRNVQDIFFTYAQKYFQFKINDGKANKTRMKTLDLFPQERILTTMPIRITLQNDSTRGDRVFLSKLNKIKSELRDIDDEDIHHIEMVTRKFCIQKGLSAYYWKKILKNEEPYNKQTFEI